MATFLVSLGRPERADALKRACEHLAQLQQLHVKASETLARLGPAIVNGERNMDSPDNQIYFTRQKYRELKKLYTTAVAEDQEQFDFEGHPLLTSYAKYLLEYLEIQFKAAGERYL